MLGKRRFLTLSALALAALPAFPPIAARPAHGHVSGSTRLKTRDCFVAHTLAPDREGDRLVSSTINSTYQLHSFKLTQ
jgi:hypothetical protein